MNPDLSSIVKALDRLTAVHQKSAWDYASTIVIGLTLLVLIWYTVETYKLRLATQRQTDATGKLLAEAQKQNDVASQLLKEAHRQNEIAVMPIFAVYIETSSDGFQRQIVLENVGLGPAFNLSIDSPKWDNNILAIKPSHNVMTPKQTETLSFARQNGRDRLIHLDVDGLYEEINRNQMPDPLNIIVRCVSVHHTAYDFLFKCVPDAGYLKITFDRPPSALSRLL